MAFILLALCFVGCRLGSHRALPSIAVPSSGESQRLATGDWISGSESNDYYWLFGSPDEWNVVATKLHEVLTSHGWSVTDNNDPKRLFAMVAESGDSTICLTYSDAKERSAHDPFVNQIVPHDALAKAGAFRSSVLVIRTKCGG